MLLSINNFSYSYSSSMRDNDSYFCYVNNISSNSMP